MSRKQNDAPPTQGKVERWTRLLGSVTRFLWVIVVVVLLAVIGRWLFLRDAGAGDERPRIQTKPLVEQVDWSRVDAEVAEVLQRGRIAAAEFCRQRMDEWIAANMERVDNEFLPWYFGYWTQQELGLKSLLYQVVHWVDSGTPTAAERITRRVQEEFAARVLRPQVAQMELERMVKDTVAIYSGTVRSGLDSVAGRYDIHPAEWDRYINDVAVMVRQAESGRSVSLSLKAVTAVAAGGAVVLYRLLRPAISRLTANLSARLAGRTAARMASKTGAQAAARVGGRFAGALIAVGVIIWDVWDHYNTRKQAQPVLRQNIFDYFAELKEALLHDPEFGVLTVIAGLEQQLAEKREVIQAEVEKSES